MRGKNTDGGAAAILYGVTARHEPIVTRPDQPIGSRLARFSEQELISSLFTDREGAFENVAGYSGNNIWCVRSLLPKRWIPQNWGKLLRSDNGSLVASASADLDSSSLHSVELSFPDAEQLQAGQLARSTLWTGHMFPLIAVEELSPEQGKWVVPAGIDRNHLLYVSNSGRLLGAVKVIPNTRYSIG